MDAPEKPKGFGDFTLTDALLRDQPGLGSIADLDPNVPRPDTPKPFDPAAFARTAKEFFEADRPDRRRNATLEMFDAAMGAYIDAKRGELAAALAPLQEQLNAAISIADRALNASTAADNFVTQFYERLAEFEKRVDDPAAALEGFKASISERLKLQEARKLWGDSAATAKRDLRRSGMALLFLLVAVPALAIWQSDAIFQFFRAIGNAVLVDLPANASETAILIAAVSRLVLVTLPVALYIWLIRIVVRFNMRSLLLMDDANQRNTMLETYLHLVEQDAEVKSDRPLILEALFRRTPGHGPDTIEPPNLADILRIGAPGKA